MLCSFFVFIRAQAQETLVYDDPIRSYKEALNLFLQKKHHLFAMEGTSYRFPAMVLGGLALVIVYLWGAEARGRIAGLFAALFLGLMPRFFFQAHLACFDVPIVTMWTLTAYAYWKSLRAPSLVWPVLTWLAAALVLLPVALLTAQPFELDHTTGKITRPGSW